MKIRLSLVSLFTALFVAGCGKNDAASTTASAPASTPAAASAAPAKAAGPHTFEVTANDTMKFVYNGQESGPGTPLRLEAKSGEDIKIVLTNAGTLPKEAMGHNLVVLKPGSDVNAFSAAAATAKDKDYVPDALKDQIVGHTALLGPRKSDEVNLKGLAAGEYPFLCSFPGHAPIGMKGVLVVQ
jgi:azurin